jgi:tetratricopeptide (TPR) repeat protein
MIILICLIIFVLNYFVINYYFKLKPDFPDEGNWAYNCLLRKKGLKLYKDYFMTISYFSTKAVYYFLYSIFGRNGDILRFTGQIRVLWYSMTLVTNFLLVFLLWENIIISLISNVIFLAIMVNKNTSFSLTYSEHNFLLPIGLSIITLVLYLKTNIIYFALLTGLFSAIAFQIKIVSLFYNLLICLCFLGTNYKLIGFLSYLFGFVLLNVLPFLLPWNIRKEFYVEYYRRRKNFWGRYSIRFWFFYMYEKAEKVIKINSKKIKNLRNNTPKNHYVTDVLNKPKGSLFKEFKKHQLENVNLYRTLIVLAFVQIIVMLINFSWLEFTVVLYFFSMIFSQQIQHSYFPGHFNQVWSPLSILAAKSLFDIISITSINITAHIFIVSILILEFSRIIRNLYESKSRKNRELLGNFGERFTKHIRIAEDVGHYIKENSNVNDELLIWGNLPTISCYAERKLHLNISHMYPSGGKILHRIGLEVERMKLNPPEWMVYEFKNTFKDKKWSSIEYFMDKTNLPYKLEKKFIGKLEGKVVTDFYVYQIDQEIYREVLLDCYKHYKNEDYLVKVDINGNKPKDGNKVFELRMAGHEFLDKLCSKYNNDIEIDYCKRFSDSEDVDVDAKLEYLESISSKCDEINQARLLRLKAENLIILNRIEEAEDLLQSALKLNNKDFRIYTKLGEIEFIKSNLNGALKYFQSAYKINKFSAEVYNNIGVVMYFSRQFIDAKNCFTKALSIWSEYREAKDNLHNVPV